MLHKKGIVVGEKKIRKIGREEGRGEREGDGGENRQKGGGGKCRNGKRWVAASGYVWLFTIIWLSMVMYGYLWQCMVM